MTKPARTTPPPDAATRRRAPPVLTYSVEQLPTFDAAFYNGHALRARPEITESTFDRVRYGFTTCLGYHML